MHLKLPAFYPSQGDGWSLLQNILGHEEKLETIKIVDDNRVSTVFEDKSKKLQATLLFRGITQQK